MENCDVYCKRIQKLPELLEYIQAEIDEHPEKGRFILTGSHQPELETFISESLAGRTGIVELLLEEAIGVLSPRILRSRTTSS